MTRPALRDVDAYQGDTFVHELRFVDKDTGQPISVVGRTFSSQVRRRWSDDTVEATFTVDVSQAAAGVVTFTLPAATVAGLDPCEYRYDIQQNVGGVILTLVRGKFTVTGEITR